MEYTYNNAIVNVFVKLLGESIALKSPGLFDPFKVTSEAFGDLGKYLETLVSIWRLW